MRETAAIEGDRISQNYIEGSGAKAEEGVRLTKSFDFSPAHTRGGGTWWLRANGLSWGACSLRWDLRGLPSSHHIYLIDHTMGKQVDMRRTLTYLIRETDGESHGGPMGSADSLSEPCHESEAGCGSVSVRCDERGVESG